MHLKQAIIVVALLSTGTMYADTTTINLGPSQQDYTLIGTGGTGGPNPYGTYLNQQGTCSPGTGDTTTCLLTGTYSSTNPEYSSGNYSLVTTYDTADGGLPSISQAPVDSGSAGNFFNLIVPFSSDVQMALELSNANTVPIVTNGQFVGTSLLFLPVDATPECTGLPNGVSCTQGNVGLYTDDSLYGPVTGALTFNNPSQVPEPEWLALGGMLPGLFVTLRRRLTRSA